MARTWSELRNVALASLCSGAVAWFGLRSLPDLLADRALKIDAVSFVETACTNVATATLERSSRYHTYFTPVLICDYEVAKRIYRIDSRVSELGFVIAQGRVQALQAAQQRAETVVQHAYYDPGDPARATMSRDVKGDGTDWFFVALGVPFAAVALLGMVSVVIGGVQNVRRARRDREDFPTARTH